MERSREGGEDYSCMVWQYKMLLYLRKKKIIGVKTMLDFIMNPSNYPTELEVWKVAAILGCTSDTVRRYIHQGKLGYILVGRKYLIPRDSLEAYITKNIMISL